MRRSARVRASRRLAARLALVLAVAAMLASQSVASAAAATPSPWQLAQRPWADGVTVNDIAAAAPSLLAAAGAGGRVAVSLTGGTSWVLRSPADQGIVADLFGIAFRDAAQGIVVGAAGTLIVTSDGGATWQVPAFSGSEPSVDLNDVAVAGTRAAAVGERRGGHREHERRRLLAQPASAHDRRPRVRRRRRGRHGRRRDRRQRRLRAARDHVDQRGAREPRHVGHGATWGDRRRESHDHRRERRLRGRRRRRRRRLLDSPQRPVRERAPVAGAGLEQRPGGRAPRRRAGGRGVVLQRGLADLA